MARERDRAPQIRTTVYVFYFIQILVGILHGFRGIMHLHKKRGKSKGAPGPSGLAVFRGGRGRPVRGGHELCSPGARPGS